MKKLLIILMIFGLQAQIKAMESCIPVAATCCILVNAVAQDGLQNARERIEPKSQSQKMQDATCCSPACCFSTAYNSMTVGLWIIEPPLGAAFTTGMTLRDTYNYHQVLVRAQKGNPHRFAGPVQD